MDEQLQQCIYCNNILTAKGFFCPKCTKQVRCKECKEYLEKDANACIYCGTAVTVKIENSSFANAQPAQMNQIELHETRSTRSIKAVFTDNVGASVSTALAGFVGKGLISKPAAKFSKESFIDEGTAEVVGDDYSDVEEEVITKAPELPAVSSHRSESELEQIKKIFRFEEDKVTLLETRLKAVSRLDYARRLVILLIYGHQLLGNSNVPRAVITKVLIKSGLNDGGTRQWIANNKLMNRDEKTKTLEINTPGEEAARRYLQEIADVEIKDVWHFNASSRRKKQNKNDNNQDTHNEE